jgi:hypothetical protein
VIFLSARLLRTDGFLLAPSGFFSPFLGPFYCFEAADFYSDELDSSAGFDSIGAVSKGIVSTGEASTGVISTGTSFAGSASTASSLMTGGTSGPSLLFVEKALKIGY